MSASTYDELPYADYCFARTHPEHLYAMSVLCDRAAPRFETARVLEIGCARGSNLLAMAVDLPRAEFVGVDLSSRQVDEARERAARIGLGNVRFDAMSLADVGAREGTFDYVVCHGVYSWVTADVRDAVLRVCRERLRPDGVAYVSFNTLPGWNALRTLRDFLRLHVAPGPAPRRLEHARRALTTLADAVRNERASWAVWLRDELAWIAAADDSYVFHEYLEDVNHPVHLAEFVSAARSHGLAHLADADLAVAAPALRAERGDPIALAQSLDFAANRRFRAALLVPVETAAGRAEPAAVARSYFAALATLAQDVRPGDLTGPGPVAFTVDDRRIESRDPWIKCALALLDACRPRPMSYAAISTAVGTQLGLDGPGARRLAAVHAVEVLDLLLDGALELRGGEARYAAVAGPRPVASPLARRQIASSATVATLRHTRLELPPIERAILPLLDGTRGRSALVAALRRRPIEGESMATDAVRTRRCEESLDWLARNALLMP